MIIRTVFFVFFVQILFPGLGYGQGNFARPGNVPVIQDHQSAPQNNDISEWRLPPLQVLIDHAIKHSNEVKLADNDILMSEYLYKDVRRDWLKKINVSGDARYGSMFDLARLSQTPGVSILPQSNNLILYYGIGLTASTSISDLVDKKRTKQKSQLTIEQSKLTKEGSINGIKEKVITEYYNILSLQKTLATSNEIFLMISLVHEKARMDLAQNKISYTEYATDNQAFLNAQNALELQKYELERAVRVLEIIVGIELLKKTN